MEIGTLIVLAVICLAVGFFANGLLHALEGSGETTPVEGVHLRRDPRDGHPIIEVDGKTVGTPSELTFEQRASLQNALLDLQNYLAPRPTTVSAAPAEHPPAGMPATSSIGTSTPAMPKITSSGALPSVDIKPLETVKPVKFSLNPVNILARAIEADIPKFTPPPKSIVAQVNDILQEKIKDTPLALRGIELTEKDDHTMLVIVGLEKYDGIEAVPDEEIKALIRQCVAEWSNQAK